MLLDILKRSIKYVVLIACFVLLAVVVALCFRGIISTFVRDVSIIGICVVAFAIFIWGWIKFSNFKDKD